MCERYQVIEKILDYNISLKGSAIPFPSLACREGRERDKGGKKETLQRERKEIVGEVRMGS